MNPTPPALPGKSRRKLSPGCMVCLILLGIVVALLAWHVVWRIGNSRAVARLEKAARDRGEPVTLAELAATYPEIPHSSNAYTALAEIWESEDPGFWSAFNAGEVPLPEHHKEQIAPNVPIFSEGFKMSHTNPISPESMEAAATFLSQNKERMDKVRAALARTEFRAPIALEDGYAALLPYLAEMKNESRYFQLEALHRIESGQIESAISSISNSASVGHCLKNDPLLIGHLVRVACNSMTIAASERLMTSHRLTDNQFARLAAVISSLKSDDAFKKSMLGERVIGWSVYTSSPRALRSLLDGEDGQSTGEISYGFGIMRFIGLADADKRLMGETYQKILVCAQNPSYATNNQLHEIFEDMAVKARRFPPRIFTMMLMPSLKKAGDKFVRAEALRLCADTAISIERYRLIHGDALPENLADVPKEFLPATPTDPFNGLPLRYKKLPTGFMVYSVGPDRTDNDGVLDPPKNGPLPRESDIGFRVERAGSR